jgi:formamidopyrimidine-DNA glycosylase
MPELPEVEVLVRHLRPLLEGKTVRDVLVRRERVIGGSVRKFTQALRGARFTELSRRGKFLQFTLRAAKAKKPVLLIGHLGMTGRMYLAPWDRPLPKHAAVVLDLGRQNFVFEDTRYFGKLTLDWRAVEKLGPEPLGADFIAEEFARALKRSQQAIKIKLLDQSLVAGIGNIYASEALFRAGVSPRIAARRLRRDRACRLWAAIREVLTEAIERSSTVPLSYSGDGARDGFFYFGRAPEAPDSYAEGLRVYDRQGQPCVNCGRPIQRIVQAARSTFYCAHCQQG